MRDPVAHRVRQYDPRRTVVASDGNSWWLSYPYLSPGGERPTDGVRDLRRQLVVNDPSDVVLSKNVGWNFHGPSLVSNHHDRWAQVLHTMLGGVEHRLRPHPKSEERHCHGADHPSGSTDHGHVLMRGI